MVMQRKASGELNSADFSNSRKVAVLLSGGVDSSVALHLLKQQGHHVTAFYLKVWLEDETGFGDCPWEDDLQFVHQVTARLGVETEVVSLQREYWERVIEYTLSQVRLGLTPNPDMLCNRLFKFGVFNEKYGHFFDYIATGHYAHLERDAAGRPHLMLSRDPNKDQTYFLSQLTLSQLDKAMFPLGQLTKFQVRQIACAAELPNAGRKDSQGICFLGKINYRQFLKRYLGQRPGTIVEKLSGKILGQHLGYWFYTVGQRTGMGLGGGPWFVVDKDVAENILFVTHANHLQDLNQSMVRLKAFNWLHLPRDEQGNPVACQRISFRAPVHFKIRHTPELSTGMMTSRDDEYVIEAQHPLTGVAPGQFGVIYQNGECLGGGVID